MKKIFSFISTAALILTFTGCNNIPAEQSSDTGNSKIASLPKTDSNSSHSDEDPYAGLKLSNNREKIEVDTITHDTLNELENHCSLAVIAKVIGNPRQETFYDDSLGINIFVNVITLNTVEITKVLKGDINVGDRIDVYACYGVMGKSFITFDGITPLMEGDEWVLFLSKDDFGDYYQTGGVGGRYPTKNVKNNRAFSLSEYSELGVFNEKDFNRNIYNELLEKYDV